MKVAVRQSPRPSKKFLARKKLTAPAQHPAFGIWRDQADEVNALARKLRQPRTAHAV